MRAGLVALAAATASRAAKAARPSSALKKSSSSSKASAPSSKKAASPPPKTPPPPDRAKASPPNKVCSLSPPLAKLLDINETTRSDALKRVWVYIKAQNLQNQLDKSEILCDEKLKTLFGRDKVTISEVLKFLSPHISKKE